MVTISVEGVRIPVVNVTLTDADGNITIAKTIRFPPGVTSQKNL